MSGQRKSEPGAAVRQRSSARAAHAMFAAGLLLGAASVAACKSEDCDCATAALDVLATDSSSGAQLAAAFTDGTVLLSSGTGLACAAEGDAGAADAGPCPNLHLTGCAQSSLDANCLAVGTHHIVTAAAGHTSETFDVTVAAGASGCACLGMHGSSSANASDDESQYPALETVSLPAN